MHKVKKLRLSNFQYFSPDTFIDCVTPSPVLAMIRTRKFYHPRSVIICKIYVPQ